MKVTYKWDKNKAEKYPKDFVESIDYKEFGLESID
jgi:hypothetical protein